MQITISQLKKAFNDNMAVNIDSLHVNDGEIIGLVGNNGAGKTTMFRLMLDLLKADNGYVDLTFCTNANEQTQGTGDAADTITVDPAKMEDWKRYTGAYIDDSFLIDFLLPEEYFEFIAKVCGIDNDTMRQRLDEMEEAHTRLFGRKQAKDRHRGSHAQPPSASHPRRAVQLP